MAKPSKVGVTSGGGTATSAEIGAEATATGDATRATGTLSLEVVDKGPVTKVKGTATTTALATGPDAYADAGTYAAVTGADRVFIKTKVSSGDGTDAAVATSTTKVHAIDHDRFDFTAAPIIKEKIKESEITPEPLLLTGDAAEMEAHAVAEGDATYALALTDVDVTIGTSDISGFANAVIS